MRGKTGADGELESPWLVLALLLGVVFAVYGMTVEAPLLNDDLSYVRDNALFRLPFPRVWRGVLSAGYFPFTSEATYQPLVTFFHYAAHASPALYRIAGISLHVLNAFLLFLLARRLDFAFKPALAAAALFSLFPASAEAVNISSFKGHLLAFAFSLACLLSWLESLEGRRRRFMLACCHVFLVLALLSKETGLLIPGLILLHWLCFRRESWTSFPWRRGLGLLLLSAAYLWWRFGVLVPPEAGTAFARPDPWLTLGWYARMLVIPYPLCLERTLGGSASYLFVAGLAAMFVFTARRPWLLFGLGWAVLSLIPYLHFVPFANYSPVADRYLYAASAGASLALARLLMRPGTWPALAAWVLAWGALTVSRNALYRDERALSGQTAACAPENPRAQAMLGSFHLRAFEFAQARGALEKAVALDPRFVVALNNLGIACYQLLDYPCARKAFEKALAVSDTAPLRNNLGNVLAALKMRDEALKEYRRAIEMQPAWSLPYFNAADILKEKDPKASKALLEKARSLGLGR